MAFTYDKEQRAFSDAVTRLFLDHTARGDVDSDGARANLWSEITELELPALLIPVELDGLGLSAVDMVAVLEAGGKFAFSTPLAMTIGAFTPAVAIGGHADEATAQILGQVLSGATGTLAPTYFCPEQTAPPAAQLTGRTLTAAAIVIPDAGADLLAVPAVTEADEPVLIVGSPSALGVSAIPGMGRSAPLGRLDVMGHDIGDAVVLSHDARAALPTAWVAGAAELVGMAAALLDLSTDHARNRAQFGQPIGHFQGVKHRLVDIHLDVERARSLTLYAALAISEGRPDSVQAAHRAKAAASEAASGAARAAVQVHGGIGITAAHAVSGLYLRAQERSVLLGTSDEHYACSCLRA